MIVIPMAGQSRRFMDAGYRMPKYQLPLWGQPVFDHAVRSFVRYFAHEPFLFVIRPDHDAETFVRNRIAALAIGNAEIVALDSPTRGQADTVSLALHRSAAPPEEPLTIFNIDSFRPGFFLSEDDRAADGFLEVFRGDGEGWSFVDPVPGDEEADEGHARRVLEKVRVSELCSTGLYYFASRALFDRAFAREVDSPSQVLPELYVAPLYNHLIADGLEVRYRVIPPGAVTFCGVPAEYEALRGIVCPPAFASSGAHDPATA